MVDRAPAYLIDAKSKQTSASRLERLRREYHKRIRVQKKHHWEDFLDDEQNIWQAARYLQGDSDSGFSKITSLVDHDGRAPEQEENIAHTLIQAFFPPGRPISEPSTRQVAH